jgi:hypothetical protein
MDNPGAVNFDLLSQNVMLPSDIDEFNKKIVNF